MGVRCALADWRCRILSTGTVCQDKTSSVVLTRTHVVQALTMSLPFLEFPQSFHEQFRGHLRRRDFQRADQHPPRRQITVRILQRPFWTGRIRGTWKQHQKMLLNRREISVSRAKGGPHFETRGCAGEQCALFCVANGSFPAYVR